MECLELKLRQLERLHLARGPLLHDGEGVREWDGRNTRSDRGPQRPYKHMDPTLHCGSEAQDRADSIHHGLKNPHV